MKIARLISLIALLTLSTTVGITSLYAQNFDESPIKEPEFNLNDVYRYEEAPPIGGRTVKKKKKKKSKVKFRGYTKQKPYFFELCMALYRDGRSQPISNLAANYKGGVDDCVACKHLYRLLYSQCKKKPKKKKRDEEEIIPAKQQDPSTDVIDLTSRLFLSMFEDTKQRELHFQGVRHFVNALRAEERGEEEEEWSSSATYYYDVLAEYVYAPFRAYDELTTKVKYLKKREREQREREFGMDSSIRFGEIERFFGEDKE